MDTVAKAVVAEREVLVEERQAERGLCKRRALAAPGQGSHISSTAAQQYTLSQNLDSMSRSLARTMSPVSSMGLGGGDGGSVGGGPGGGGFGGDGGEGGGGASLSGGCSCQITREVQSRLIPITLSAPWL